MTVSNLITNLACCGKYHYFKDRKQITINSSDSSDIMFLAKISLFQRSFWKQITTHAEETESIQFGKYHYFKDRKQITTAVGNGNLSKVVANIIHFKDRKQITTVPLLSTMGLCLANIIFQRSKANHNTAPWQRSCVCATVFIKNHQDKDFESKSQPIQSYLISIFVKPWCLSIDQRSKTNPQLSSGSGWYCFNRSNIIFKDQTNHNYSFSGCHGLGILKAKYHYF